MIADSHNDARTVPVLVPTPAATPYTYVLAEGQAAPPGTIVQVPLGPRQVPGLVWEADEDAEPVDPKKLRCVTQVFDCPPVGADMRRFIAWVARYTLTAPGMVARMVLRVPAAFEPERPVPGLRLTDARPDRLTDARRRVLALAAENGPLAWTKSGLAHAAGVTPSVIDGLVKAGSFEAVDLPPQPVVAAPEADFAEPRLDGAQRAAAETLGARVRKDAFSVTLLEGVTGAGKTEVYFEAIAAALAKGRQVLVLLPEIALTQSFMERFAARFGAPPAPWHSDLAPKSRERVWRQVAEGQVKVVAGARSALFLPFADPGLVVVDEEHDAAYKQEDRVFYNARDMAVVRAKLGGFPAVLVSATPSVESRHNAQTGRYHHLHLPRRFADAALPDVGLVDMRKSAPERGGFLSPVLLEAMAETLERGEQSLLFLNRRGYAPLTLCRACGHRFACQNCSAWLVEHRFRGQLQCHHCGHHEPVPAACPECGTFDHLVACGPGIERIAEETLKHFEKARVIVLSSDMVGGVKRLRLEMEAIARGEADIIIGTQLVAKGHNFPLLTLVGVVDADLGLANGDPRAAERTFQLLSQVTGRAGRTGRRSHGLIQTYQPDHPVLKACASGDSDAFYAAQLAERRQGQLPPFGRLAALIVSANDRAEAERHARALRAAAPAAGDIAVLGPAEAPLAMVRGRHRFRLLVHGTERADMQAYLHAMIGATPNPRGSVRVAVDVDPQSFL
ncbi:MULTISPECIES: primosomal protein N' [unclassified Roseitalea]|uniref:primosomal protein N' n=1 Tax=unclassified Roseitalea TaxID=2639107 RepID=UPI00273E7936|nr:MULTISPECIES: primosomal protein N' [unclassified Roseitalea]